MTVLLVASAIGLDRAANISRDHAGQIAHCLA
jgi:hypothetical protein